MKGVLDQSGGGLGNTLVRSNAQIRGESKGKQVSVRAQVLHHYLFSP